MISINVFRALALTSSRRAIISAAPLMDLSAAPLTSISSRSFMAKKRGGKKSNTSASDVETEPMD